MDYKEKRKVEIVRKLLMIFCYMVIKKNMDRIGEKRQGEMKGDKLKKTKHTGEHNGSCASCKTARIFAAA